jgi:serine/threonine-protein kinase
MPGVARPPQPAAPIPAATPAVRAPSASPSWRAEDAPPPPLLPAGYGVTYGAATDDAPALVPPPRTPPADASKEMRRAYRQARDAWKEEQKELRRAWKTREQVAREEYGDAARPPLPAPYVRGGPAARAAAAPDETELLEMRAEAFRRKAFGSFFMIAFLAFINLVTFPVFPWAIFPAWGMLGRLSARWRPLGAAGLDRWDVLLEGPATAVARMRGDGNALAASVRRPSERTVRAFRRSVRGVAVAAGFALLMLILGLSTGQEVFLVLLMAAMLGVLVFGVRALRFGVATRRSGIRPSAALSRGWRDALAAADPRPREERLREEARQLAGDAVLAGRHGAALLGALDDRLAVRETIARLAPADRALIPDVTPTVDALVEKVGALVQSLHRLDDGVRPGALAELEARLATARAEPADMPDRERRLQLLERQRASLADLEQRRATLAAQLESAQLVLQNVKLDLMKLRASGVGALAETTSATQEARALSRDIGYALEAAAEVRGR